MSESLNTQELTDNSSIIPIPTESTDAAQDIISVSNEDTTTTTIATTESRVRKSSSPNEENDKKRSKKEFHSRQK